MCGCKVGCRTERNKLCLRGICGRPYNPGICGAPTMKSEEFVPKFSSFVVDSASLSVDGLLIPTTLASFSPASQFNDLVK